MAGNRASRLGHVIWGALPVAEAKPWFALPSGQGVRRSALEASPDLLAASVAVLTHNVPMVWGATQGRGPFWSKSFCRIVCGAWDCRGQ
jgi:hypothetical protein